MRCVRRLILAAAITFIAMPGVNAQTIEPTLANGANSTITGPDGVCKIVTNATGATIVTPSLTTGEWQSFYNNPPSGVTIAACPPACAGYSYGGNCYYRGTDGQSCTTVCASHGGCDTAATVNQIGSGGTLAACDAVMEGIDGVARSTTDNTATVGNGCYSVTSCLGSCNEIGFRSTSVATTCGDSAAAASRICGCNN